jgi:hypothetical protein
MFYKCVTVRLILIRILLNKTKNKDNYFLITMVNEQEDDSFELGSVTENCTL